MLGLVRVDECCRVEVDEGVCTSWCGLCVSSDLHLLLLNAVPTVYDADGRRPSSREREREFERDQEFDWGLWERVVPRWTVLGV